MIELKDVLTIIGLAIAIGGAFLGGLKWIITRIETRHSEAVNLTENRHTEVMGHITQVHTRVNEVKDEYVRRSELDRDVKSLEKQLDMNNKAIAEYASQTNTRIDRLLMLIGKLVSNSHGHDLDHD